jgi:hypothetical protein
MGRPNAIEGEVDAPLLREHKNKAAIWLRDYHPLYRTGGKAISLYNLSGLGLILEDASSDVTYLNQTAGHCCGQRHARGFFVFVEDETRRIYNAIAPFMENKETLSAADADYLDTVFTDNYKARHLSVDRTKLEQSEEAWVHVKVALDDESESYTGFAAETGILTWDNSD